jgi:prepilin-type N-terminal cleavage/methylation domain-containing protein
MNKVFTAKLLQNLRNKKSNKGFTLIELLVVVIIIGVLAAVALPNLLAQVGKARETEAKNGVGTINRAQQTYHFEKQSFAPTSTDFASQSNPLGVIVTSQYYSFAVTSSDANNTLVTAIDANSQNNGTRNYAGGVAHTNGAYDTALCQGSAVNDPVTATATGGAAGCSTGDTELK